MNTDIFRAYDIRGIYGVDFQPSDFYRIASAYAALFQPKIVAVGQDTRESSPRLWESVVEGFQDSGVDVLDLGQISTDMLYFVVSQYQTDGGVTVSASHNPAAYNGMKLVGLNAVPISSETGLLALRDAVESGVSLRSKSTRRGQQWLPLFLDDYLSHIRSFISATALSARRIVINANGGLAGEIVQRLLPDTRIEVCKRLFTRPDGRFAGIPGGRPDPLRPENRELTRAAVKASGADLGVAWDADADRCFFFDETGAFVEGCYITALLAAHVLEKHRSGGVIFDPRARWAVEVAVRSANGTPILNRCGHAFIKARMRKTRAVFGGEMSGHYYFRDNFCADNGMIPFLLMLERLSLRRMSLAEMVAPLRTAYPVSGEINFSFETCEALHNTVAIVKRTLRRWGVPRVEIPIDGVSVQYLAGGACWRFNLRASNTEPLLRLNVETLGDRDLLVEKTTEISATLQSVGGRRETRFEWESEGREI